MSVSREIDVAEAILCAFRLSKSVCLKKTDQYAFATAVSELGRNIIKYAERGTITIRQIERGSTKGVEVVSTDNGPGLGDVGTAMRDHYSSSGSLGLGLPGVKRLTDEFTIDTKRKVGTKITARKWV